MTRCVKTPIVIFGVMLLNIIEINDGIYINQYKEMYDLSTLTKIVDEANIRGIEEGYIYNNKLYTQSSFNGIIGCIDEYNHTVIEPNGAIAIVDNATGNITNRIKGDKHILIHGRLYLLKDNGIYSNNYNVLKANDVKDGFLKEVNGEIQTIVIVNNYTLRYETIYHREM